MTTTSPVSSEAICGTNQAGGVILFEIRVNSVVPIVSKEDGDVRVNKD